jgi:hypothetical protein
MYYGEPAFTGNYVIGSSGRISGEAPDGATTNGAGTYKISRFPEFQIFT